MFSRDLHKSNIGMKAIDAIYVHASNKSSYSSTNNTL